MNSLHLIWKIKKYAFQNKISKVLVALSGGADSIATAFLLLKAGIEIRALHCNFHLRGEESQRDNNFVIEFCKFHKIPLEQKDFDIINYISLNKSKSIEMACRELRYRWFDVQLQKTGFHRIVTGHNADDNIETLFINLFRGTGTRGLRGMTTDTGKIWRPILNIHRKEILDILTEFNVSYVTDSSNLQSDYRRNFLRNKVIPLIKTEWEGFDKALDASLLYINEENKVVEYSMCSVEEMAHNNKPLTIDLILNSPSPLLTIRRYIDITKPFPTTASEILDAIKANKPHIRKWNVRLGTIVLRGRKLTVEMGHCESSS